MTTSADAFVGALQAEEDRLLGLLGAVRDLLAFYGANRPEEITREPRQAKALRAAKAEKEIRPEPQETADLEINEAPGRIVPPAALVPVEMPDLTKPAPRERVDAVATSPERVEKPAADRHDEPVVVRRVTKASVPPNRDEKLRELWTSDLTLQQIADKLGMGHLSNVSTRAKHLGLPSRLRNGARRAAPKPAADTFDPAYYARHAIIPDRDKPPLAADITAALMGDPGHGPSLTVERAGPQQRGGEPT